MLCVCFSMIQGSLKAEWEITPSRIELHRNFEQVQLLVTEKGDARTPRERWLDRTAEVSYRSTDPMIATVSEAGQVIGIGNGSAKIEITKGSERYEVPVEVTGVVSQPALDFVEHVLPVIYKAGCNAGTCHASQYGKGGFTLSVMGFDPAADQTAMVKSSRGRRVSFANPSASLLLQKPTAEVAHGGGKRFEVSSNDYNILHAWIARGAPPPAAQAKKLKQLVITPAMRVGEVGMQQQLQVHAIYEDETRRDVTAWVRFDSRDEGVVTVSPSGLMQAVGKGQGTVLVRYSGEAELATFVVPYSESIDLAQWQSNHFVDELAAHKFKELGITPSPLCDDATFIRRIFIDALGAPPSVEDVQAFLESEDPEKRAHWVDRVLGLTGDPTLDTYNDKYAAYWSLKWADLIRNNSAVLGESGMWALHNWLKESFRTNKPFDQFVRELVTAKGSIFSNGPANYYRVANNPSDLAESTSQLFLGTRLQCAKCHHHPYEKYSQADYYGFAAFFSRVGTKPSTEFGLFGGESVVMVKSTGEVSHPKTGAVMKPTPLGGEPIDDPLDRRIPLADWLTSKENDRFAHNVVNRYMAYLMGRGLVDPVDDLRSTNPPSNAALYDRLAKEFVEDDFNVKQLMRIIMTSRLYQLDSQPLPQNASDDRFYSHYKPKRLSAEALLDAIDYVTGSPTKHPNLPLGTRATELPDAKTTNEFLITFGKPKRASVCECERTPDENLAQALHTLNGEIVAKKVADDKGRVAQLVAAKKPVEEIVRELYLASLARYPSNDEMQLAVAYVNDAKGGPDAYQDLLWALLNSKQFLFVH